VNRPAERSVVHSGDAAWPDNTFDITESLLIGADFGVVTDIKNAPNGNLVPVSLDQGAIHEISRR